MAQIVSNTGIVTANASGANLSTGRVSFVKIVCINSSGAAAWVQFFDAPVASVTLGTTVPLLSVPVAATTGFAQLDFVQPQGWTFDTRCSVFATTTPTGNSDPGAGIAVQAWVN